LLGSAGRLFAASSQIGAAEEVLDTRGRAAMIQSPKSGTPEKMSQPRLILIGAGVLLSLGMGIPMRAWRTGVLIGFGAGIVQILAGGPPRRRSPVIEPRLAPLSP
jgi:hypothetical protein